MALKPAEAGKGQQLQKPCSPVSLPAGTRGLRQSAELANSLEKASGKRDETAESSHVGLCPVNEGR